MNVISNLVFHSSEDLKAKKATSLQQPSGSTAVGSPSTSQNSTSTLSGDDLVGQHVDHLGVEVLDGVAVYVAGAQYSMPRLKEHFGKDLCWPVAVSNKRGNYALTVCPCKGQAGHEAGGPLHQIDKEKKGYFIKHSGSFRLRKGDAGFREGSWWQAENGQP